MIPEISPVRFSLMVIATVIMLILAAIFCTGCTGTPPTADQINAYSAAAHGAIHGAVQDYKGVKPLIKK